MMKSLHSFASEESAMGSSDLPFVIIIILNWNNASDSINCLTSLQNLDYGNYDVVLIDNASTDDSVEQIRACYPNIKIVESSSNLGVGGGRNIGIDLVLEQVSDHPEKAPEYIVFLDNDTETDRGFLSELVTVAQAGPEIGVLGCKVYYMDKPNRIWAAGGKLFFYRGTAALRGMDEQDVKQYDIQEEIDFAVGCAFMVSREALLNVGKFDSIFGIYWGEEIDWCIRAKKAGYLIVYVPHAKIFHRTSRTTPGANYWQQKARNLFILMRRYASKKEWLIFMLSFPLIFLRAVWRQIQRGRFKNILHLIRGSIASVRTRSR